MNEAKDTACYVIVSESERGFWSNEQGWVFDKDSATVFTAEEEVQNLPLSAGDDAQRVPFSYALRAFGP